MGINDKMAKAYKAKEFKNYRKSLLVRPGKFSGRGLVASLSIFLFLGLLLFWIWGNLFHPGLTVL